MKPMPPLPPPALYTTGAENPPAPSRPSDYAVLVWGVLTVIGIPFVLWRLWRWRSRRPRQPA